MSFDLSAILVSKSEKRSWVWYVDLEHKPLRRSPSKEAPLSVGCDAK
jgi:hypothetical protein